MAPCASRLYEAVARPGQLSRQVEEWLGWVRTVSSRIFFFYVIVINCQRVLGKLFEYLNVFDVFGSC